MKKTTVEKVSNAKATTNNVDVAAITAAVIAALGVQAAPSKSPVKAGRGIASKEPKIEALEIDDYTNTSGETFKAVFLGSKYICRADVAIRIQNELKFK